MSGQPRISLIVADIRNAAEAKLVSLVDRTGLEVAWSGNRDVRVNLHRLIGEAGEEVHAVVGLERLAAAGTVWTADERSAHDHADIAVLNGRWSLILVYRTEDAIERTRRELAQSLDALRFTLAAVEAEREASTFPDVSPEGGGGTSPPAELGIPIWWIRQVREALP
jgi:hypothetical protein